MQLISVILEYNTEAEVHICTHGRSTQCEWEIYLHR